MAPPKIQTGLVRQAPPDAGRSLPLRVCEAVPVPHVQSPSDVLVRVLAVALNPTDVKMVLYDDLSYEQASCRTPIGCDFCGIVEDGGPAALERFPRGSRVCGGLFPYGHDNTSGDTDKVSGAFAEWLVADSGLLLRVPDTWSDLAGAAIGGVCWGACMLALFLDPDALALPAGSSQATGANKPSTKKGTPVLVYGGGTASGTMACQLLKRSGYSPIAVTSNASASLSQAYGADATATYTSPTCAEQIRELAPSLHHAFDCIVTPESVAICFASLSRAGGRYACLENLEPSWRTRRAVRVKEVYAYEATGRPVTLGSNSPYSRAANHALHDRACAWAATEMQPLIDGGFIQPHPVRQIEGDRWKAIQEGLGQLQRGEVHGEKLAVRLAGGEGPNRSVKMGFPDSINPEPYRRT